MRTLRWVGGRRPAVVAAAVAAAFAGCSTREPDLGGESHFWCTRDSDCPTSRPVCIDDHCGIVADASLPGDAALDATAPTDAADRDYVEKASSTPCSGAPSVDPTAYPPCPTCGGGRCVPKADYPTVPLEVLTECDPNTVCLPEDLVAAKGAVQLAKCTSVLGAEGRCMSLCVTVAAQLAAMFPQDVCTEDERCVPCFNPNDGSETGVCRVGCDEGPTTQPVVFPKCCSGRGDCVPSSAIPAAYSGNLSSIDCSGTDEVCIPSALVANPTTRLASCVACVSAVPDLPCVPYGPGACVPDCIVDATVFGNRISAGTGCSTGEKCAPCKDPTGKDTGACPPATP